MIDRRQSRNPVEQTDRTAYALIFAGVVSFLIAIVLTLIKHH